MFTFEGIDHIGIAGYPSKGSEYGPSILLALVQGKESALKQFSLAANGLA